MNKKLSHLGLFAFDIFFIGVFWFGHSEIRQTLMEIESQADTIRFGSRDGFFIVGIGFLLIHLLIIVEHFWRDLVVKYKKGLNIGIVAMVVLLISSGLFASSWVKLQVETAGYVYCSKASGAISLIRTLVYTIDTKICEELVMAAKNK